MITHQQIRNRGFLKKWEGKNLIGFLVLLIILGAGVGLMIYQRSSSLPASDLDNFAKCLAAKGAVMYGAYWCPHCQNEKAAFGSSFKYVPYVECTQETQKCLTAGIKGYPTWIFSDGRRFEGEQGLEKLSAISSCPLKQNQ